MKDELVKELEIKFDQFIAAVGSGSTRSRNILNLLMTASFVALLALYNSISPKYNWLSSRIQSTQNAYPWVRFLDDDPKRFKSIRLSPSDSLIENRFTLETYRKTFANMHPLTGGDVDSIKSMRPHLSITIPAFYLNPDSTINLSKIDTLSVYAALKSISQMNAISRQELDDIIRAYDRARIENVLLIKIPILGISFDINGLAIISAVAFGILFFLLYHSLSRERKNLTLVFKLAMELGVNNLKLYQLLSMQQVLTVPSSVDEYILSQKKEQIVKDPFYEKWKNMVLRLFTLAPIVAPMFIWAIIYFNDDQTEQIGNSINAAMTRMTAQFSMIFGLFSLLMMLSCVYEWYQISKLWQKESLDIRDELIGHLLTDEERARISWWRKIKKKVWSWLPGRLKK